jgi:aminoglycoside 6-adenylyltransferase
MRSEQEMLDLILTFAREHEEVRAVVMNGSRVNPNAPRDPFQDYDIVYLVPDVEPFKQNLEVIGYFGEMMILQTPEDMGDPPPANEGSYAYLMQFMDGNRIDLTFCPLTDAQRCVEDTLSVVLLDKDHRFAPLPPPNDHGYFPQPPTAKQFDDCCNEFWWVSPYVAKALWRDELLHAAELRDTAVRDQLMKMLIWYFGIKTDFKKAPGKVGKYIQGWIEPELWALLERTYSDLEPEHIWDSLLTMGALFRTLAHTVAAEFGFTYPERDERNVSAYLRHLRMLPKDAPII